jgi:hypothetical protein
MIYELSRDYARAWELIQQGEKLACWVDCSERPSRCTTDISKDDDCLFFLEPSIFDDWQEKILNLSRFERFVKRCTERDAEFYLPTASTNYSELLAEIQPQIITNDEQNDANLARIERLWNIENRTSDEEKILNLLLLLSEKFEENAYPMRSSWIERVIYRVQAFIFRW